MSTTYKSIEIIKSIKQTIELFTAKAFADLTEAIQELKNKYVDLSNDTVAEDKLALGYTAHDANGDPIVGTGINADTVDGWHISVRDDGSNPPSGVKNTLTFVYTAGG